MDLLLEYEASIPLDVEYESIIKNVIEKALEEYRFPSDTEVSVTLTDNKRIHEVNKEFREIDRPTDVLSFPMLEFETPGVFSAEHTQMDLYNPDTGALMLGDIMISVEKVMEQAENYGHSVRRELAFLVAHSMLHLFGFDHMQEEERIDMEQRQEELLKQCGYTRD